MLKSIKKTSSTKISLRQNVIYILLILISSHSMAEKVNIKIKDVNDLIEYIAVADNKTATFIGVVSKVNPLQPYPVKRCLYENTQVETECAVYNFILDEKMFPNIKPWLLYSSSHELSGKIEATGIPRIMIRGIVKGSGMILFMPRTINTHNDT